MFFFSIWKPWAHRRCFTSVFHLSLFAQTAKIARNAHFGVIQFDQTVSVYFWTEKCVWILRFMIAKVVMIQCNSLADTRTHMQNTHPNYHVRRGHRQRSLLCVHFSWFLSFWCVRPNANDLYAYSMATPIVAMNVTMGEAMNFARLLFWILH